MRDEGSPCWYHVSHNLNFKFIIFMSEDYIFQRITFLKCFGGPRSGWHEYESWRENAFLIV
jgi:hypothetical protein